MSDVDTLTGERYAAFISYRHVQPDRSWAKWLHRALETYRVPRRLVRDKGVARRVGTVFRDEEELPASPHLSAEIETALRRSRLLVVVCSPRAPASEWIDREVRFFREIGRGDRILALLIEGEPREAFPRSLREIRRRIDSHEGPPAEHVEAMEPLAADVRASRTERARGLRRAALLRLLAAIVGCTFDELRQRDAERRFRRAVGTGTALVALTALLAGALLLAVRATRRAHDNMARLLVERGREDLLAGHPERALDLLTEAIELHEDDRFARLLIADAWARVLSPVREIRVADASITDCRLEQDGTTVVTADDRGRLIRWSVATGDQIQVVPAHRGTVSALDALPDGRLLTTGADGIVRLWRAGQPAPVWERPVASEGELTSGTAVTFDGSGTRVVVGDEAGGVRVLDASTGRSVRTLQSRAGNGWAITQLRSGPHGWIVARSGPQNALYLWEAADAAEPRLYLGATGAVVQVVIDDAGPLALGMTRLPPAPSWREPLRSWEGPADVSLHLQSLRSATQTRDDQVMVTSGRDGTARLWSRIEGGGWRQAAAISGGVSLRSATADRAGTRVLLLDDDGVVRLWRTDVALSSENGRRSAGTVDFVACLGFGGGSEDVQWGPDDRHVLTRVGKDRVRVWDLPPPLARLPRAPWDPDEQFVGWSGDGTRFLTVLPSGARWRDASTGAVLATLQGGVPAGERASLMPGPPRLLVHEKSGWAVRPVGGPVSLSLPDGSVASSSDGRYLALAETESLSWVDARDGKSIASVRHRHHLALPHLAISPDSAWLATASPASNVVDRQDAPWVGEDARRLLAGVGMIRFWALPSLTLRATLPGSPAPISAALFVAPGRFLVADRDGESVLWDVSAARPIGRFHDHDIVTAVAGSEQSPTFATAGRDGRVVFRRASDGARIADVAGHSAEVRDVLLSHSGELVVTVGVDGTSVVWSTQDGRPLLRGPLLPPGAEVMLHPTRLRMLVRAESAILVWDRPGETRAGAAARADFLANSKAADPR